MGLENLQLSSQISKTKKKSLPSRSNKGNKPVHFQPNKAFPVAYKMYPLSMDGCSIMQHFERVGLLFLLWGLVYDRRS